MLKNTRAQHVDVVQVGLWYYLYQAYTCKHISLASPDQWQNVSTAAVSVFISTSIASFNGLCTLALGYPRPTSLSVQRTYTCTST